MTFIPHKSKIIKRSRKKEYKMNSVSNPIKSEVLTVTALAESKGKLCRKASFQTLFEKYQYSCKVLH